MTWAPPRSRDYPKYGEFQAYKDAGGPCQRCVTGVAIGRLTIKVDWFRGNDVVIPVCFDCRTFAREHTQQFMESVERRRTS